ncbi:related to white collar photoreceptors-like protein-Laccaria bicolor [Serendipita indica DSM 11827]|uniref:Related to white collar photoreceptors-like protein-Laccaria bicolor n=1 Tax=Serendipita indica (strain DSM 11827) TaxID=1109443 RepID=G4TJG4_SERID|nr:related to white collar photoreceptors-like protein-Laccaria bicolor [Serendipita indica DSM 11827]
MDDEETTHQKSGFEFTKRKRWADLLVSELVNVAILVLSQTGTIIHCDAAVHTVTGYAEDQVLGKNFADLLHQEDTLAFFKAFEGCIASNKELTFYLRIKGSDPRDRSTRLVELKANPFQASDTDECLCVFAMLSPYPTSSINDLDDYLALKLENEQLAARLEALRNGNVSEGTFDSGSDDDADLPMRNISLEENIVDKSERALAQASAALDAAAAAAAAASGQLATSSTYTFATSGETVENPAKKKRRTLEGSQGRVCTACGRDNSPEWRKGPQGPKTLCNACGLRWAKKAKGSTKDGAGDVE